MSASIPMLLLELMDKMKVGDLVMAVGFGVGLSWGVAIFEYVGRTDNLGASDAATN